MAAQWYTIPQNQPGDGQTVWVRLNYWFGQPFLATYDRNDQTFTANYGDAFVYPFQFISRWRAQ